MKHTKYVPYPTMQNFPRQWPDKQITKAPIWCSVDLRDGNQALEVPMNLEQKIDFFSFLVSLGFKEIEVGFPAASDTEFKFTRTLIEENLIPDDVTIQVLTQAREHIIERTFEALAGAKNAVVHLYNSTSTLQRDVVFNKNKEEIKELAVYGASLIKKLAQKYGEEHYTFEYSPESFTGTEMDYAAEICNAVLDVWQPEPAKKAIINLPSTVEMSTPNVYADQIEYMCRHIERRDQVLISLHTHNDRGTGVAATELGLMAGADRVEGTLFGNGERTGNSDIINVALNMFTQGIDPELNLQDIDGIIQMYEKHTQMPVHPRHPYAGNLVFTAFSGSHQDAIKKGMARQGANPKIWQVPYLPIDPQDLGRSYDPIIRINSQSGKGGVAYILEKHFGVIVPKVMQQDFSRIVTKTSDQMDKEMTPQEIYDLFVKEYINLESPLHLIRYEEKTNGESFLSARITMDGKEAYFEEYSDGMIDAFCKGLKPALGISFEIISYGQHSLEYGSKSRAITYLHITDDNGRDYFGAGVSASITRSSLRSVVSAVNNMLRLGKTTV